MKITRRFFMRGGAVAAILAAGGAVAAPALRPESAIAAWLRTRFPGVKLSSDDLERFAVDIQAVWKLPPAQRRLVFLLMRRPFLRAAAPASVLASVERQERWVLTQFSKSTDMFDADWDGETLTYLDLADPYGLGCANPAARPPSAVSEA